MKLNIYGNQPIIAPRDPELPMEVTTKNYVDTLVGTHASDSSLHITTAERELLSGLTIGSSALNQLEGLTGNVQQQLDARVKKAGDTMTGPLVLPGNPMEPLQAATKQYVDAIEEAKLDLAGGVMTGNLFLVGDPTSNLHGATKRYVDNSVANHAADDNLHITATQNEFLDAVTVSAVEVNRLDGVTGNVQTQIDERVRLDGGVMTGELSLSGLPTVDAHAANKKYVDDKDALAVKKAGDTMTGPLVLSGAPVLETQAANKKYVDDQRTAHEADKSLHLTEGQNTWIDGITVSSEEVNRLAGVEGDVQTLLNAKFDKVGGTISGDVTLAEGKTVFVSKVPEGQTELVNKAYVDSRIKGLQWRDPVTEVNLVDDSLSTPPTEPVIADTYIVGAAATGEWLGKEGYVVQFQDEGWKFLQGRPVQKGDRFGVGFTTETPVSGGLVGNGSKIATVVSVLEGVITYSFGDHTPSSTTLVFDPEAKHFGVSYSFTDEGHWVATNTSANLTPGEGMRLDGNLLNLNLGDGIAIVDNIIAADLDKSTGLDVVGGKVAMKAANPTVKLSAAGAEVGAGVLADIADRVSKTVDSDVSAVVTVKATGGLRVESPVLVGADATNKTYVDGLDAAMDLRVDSLETTVGGLTTDAVTKAYVDQQDELAVKKTGSTMTGHLTLNADPTSNLHAVTKAYSDAELAEHAADDSLHITPTQNTFLDGITITSTEANYLEGVTSPVQAQIDSKLKRDGDTLTGPLNVHLAPVANMQVANKQYVDEGVALKVSKSGDTMTGALVLPGAPTTSLEAANKGYVDSEITSHTNNTNLHISAGERVLLSGITVDSTEINSLEGVTGNVQTQVDSKLPKAGGTLTGDLALAGAPTLGVHATNKTYVDDGLALGVKKAGDTMTGALVLPGAPEAELEAANKGYVDSEKASLKDYVDSQDALKLNKTGGTLTGSLILKGAPEAELEAATKQYVDTGLTTLQGQIETDAGALGGRVTTLEGEVAGLLLDPVTKEYVDQADALKLDKTGGTMTGHLLLHANPVQDLHPATKQYVDAIAQGLAVKPAVRFGTSAPLAATYNNGTQGVNSTLTASANGVLILDGKEARVGDRVLVMHQTNKAQNGDYTVQQIGNAGTPFILKRVVTADQSEEIPGSYFYIFGGDTLKGTGWVFTVDNPITFKIGTDPIYVNQFSGQGSIIAGDGLLLEGNTLSIGTANSNRIVVSGDYIDLAVTGVTPGEYTKFIVDGYGRVSSASNPTTLQGYGITDAQPLANNLTSISAIATNGLVIRNEAGSMVTKEVTVQGVGLEVTNGSGAASGNIIVKSNASSTASIDTIVSRDGEGNFAANKITADLLGNANTATKLKTARDVSITGDVEAAAIAFDGSANVALATSLTETGVAAGTYTKVTVDVKGRVSAAENPDTLAGHGITDAATIARLEAEVADLRKEMNELYLYVMSRI